MKWPGQKTPTKDPKSHGFIAFNFNPLTWGCFFVEILPGKSIPMFQMRTLRLSNIIRILQFINDLRRKNVTTIFQDFEIYLKNPNLGIFVRDFSNEKRSQKYQELEKGQFSATQSSTTQLSIFLNPFQGLYRIVSQVFNRQDKRYPGLGFVQRCMGRARKSRVDSQVKLQLDNWEDHRKRI